MPVLYGRGRHSAIAIGGMGCSSPRDVMRAAAAPASETASPTRVSRLQKASSSPDDGVSVGE